MLALFVSVCASQGTKGDSYQTSEKIFHSLSLFIPQEAV